MKKTIGLFSLVMLMTGAVDGISNLPSIALFGQQMVFFLIMAGLLFLLPTGLISAELSAQYKTEGGVYVWAKKAFGSTFGTFVVWLQWINTMVWFPTCLTTLAGTGAYLINPQLSQNPVYLVIVSLSAFWAMTLLNLKGFKKSTKIAAWGTMLGMIVPIVLIMVLSGLWLLLGKPVALTLTHTALLPHLSHMATWTSLTAVITAFLGMELASVHVKKVKNAHKIFPKALIYAIVIIILTMGLGSLGVALTIPHQQITLVAGTVQAFSTLFTGFHLPGMEKILGVMLLFGSFGAMVNWLISPAQGLAQAAKNGYLPEVLAKENKHGVPSKILLLQGVVVSIICCAFFLMPSVNGSYWLLLDLSTELYVIMYILMFITALKLIVSFKKIEVVPGGKAGAVTLSICGLLGSTIALVVGFFPPDNINVGGNLHYLTMFSLGLILMAAPALLLKWYQVKSKQGNTNEEAIIISGSIA